MVNFNNIKIKIYDLDSVKSIIKRLSADQNTLPQFIYFPNGEPLIENLSEDINIEYENLLIYINEIRTFPDLYEKLKNKLNLKDIIKYYIVFNKEYDDIEKQETIDVNLKGLSTSVLSLLNENIKNIDKNSKLDDLIKIWNNRFSEKINLEKYIQKNKSESKKKETVFNDFDKIIGIVYTQFELEKVKFQIEIDIENISLLEIFNNIKLNTYIPFVTTHYFYKILKDFIPFVEWTNLFDKSKTYFDKYKNIDRNKNIIFKVLEKNENYNDTIDDFTEVILNNDDNNNTNIKIEHNIKKFFLTKEQLVNRILSVFDINEIKSEKDIEVNGVFYYPMQDINKYVFSDLIMNDPLFSSVLTIDETKITIKSNIFIYFNNPKVGNLTAYITKQNVKNNPPITNKKQAAELFPKNSNYIRVKISRCENIEKVKAFQTILSKLFVLYNEKYQEIINFYRDNYVDISVEEEEEQVQEDEYIENKLRNIDPDVFNANYTRKCIHPPTYIEEDEVQENINNGKKVMMFPKEITKDSIPKNYICNYDDYKYPGLRNNPFDNAKIFPFIPCCYKKDQSQIKGSRYRNYYFDEPLKLKEQKQQGIFVSKIIIPNDFFGTLPKNINKIFSVSDTKGIYYRKGMLRTTNSFINCILQSLNINNIHAITKESRIENLLMKIRNSFATEEYAIFCKQEMYDYTIQEIIDKIKNTDEYFDPKLFIRILEIKYECNIFIFTRDNKGQLILPRHIKGYYKIKNKNKCIFIYEHMGSDTDKAEYPQCELIVRKEIDETETQDNFDFNSEISKNIFNVFDEVNNSYILNRKIEFININLNRSNIFIPISQAFDTYGKVRIINFVYNSEEYISMLTSPIQPLPLDEKNLSIIYKTNINTALNFVKELNISITKQVIDNNENLIEIYGIIGNINISIPIEFGNRKIENIDYVIIKNNIELDVEETLINLSYTENTISSIEQYNKYKKLSRYITQYIFWLYSKYLKESDIKNFEDIISYENMNDFKIKYIDIQEGYVYEEVPKTFSMNNSLLVDNKLIIKSEETLKRLFYILKLSIIRNVNEIINYYNKKVIDNYYLDISDFDKYNFQVILEGVDSIDKWINEHNKVKNILYNRIQVEKINPYFFKNQLIDNNIYIAQNTDSLQKAMNISLIWNKYKYNSGYESQEEELNYEFILYSYTNFKNIKMYNIDGEENNYNIKIIGYKFNDKGMYTVLLNI